MMRLVLLLLSGSVFAQNVGNRGSEAPVRVITAGKGWLQGSRQIARGDRLSAVPLTLKETSDLVLDCGAAGWLSYSCVRLPCSIPVCSTKDVAGVATVHRVDPPAPRVDSPAASPASRGSWLISLLTREPKTPEILGVRAGGRPADALLVQDTKGVHWAPALTRVLEGRYCFRLARLPIDAAEPARRFTLDWDRLVDSEGVAKVSNLSPGAYSLEKGTPGAGDICRFDDPDAAPVWVVIAPEAGFARLNAEWQGYRSWLTQLDESGASPAVVTTVRHAALSGLADSLARK